VIPKKIHYIWFGGKPLPEDAERCIASWKRFCPDYEIVRWDESNFDLDSNAYVNEAYKAKKWAFVSDYVRLWVLVNFGGVYMDTDVEIRDSLDPFMKHRAFSGFESPDAVPTGIMACETGFPLFQELLDDYSSRHFIKEDGTYDLCTNVMAITHHCLAKGLVLNNTYQEIDGFALYPNDWFCPKSHETGVINLTENSVAIHHFSGSWVDPLEKELLQERRSLINKHPKLPPLFAGAFVRLRYGFTHGDFSPFLSTLRLYIRSRN
jgi:mannosyltransferase OCH1-like enzyme